MFIDVWRRGRMAALIGACVAVLATGAAAAGAGAAAAQPQARVPWKSVGPGWELAQYTTGTQAKHGPTTLYLVSPAGARYSLYTWRASAGFTPGLIAWSGDKTRALFNGNSQGQVAQLDLLTGTMTRFRLAGQAYAIGYTRPDGLNILGVRIAIAGQVATLARYSLTGKLVKVLATSAGYSIGGAYSADGTTLAVSGTTGLRLISNAGRMIRRLPVPGTDPNMGCWPSRWWNAGTVLSECFDKKSYIPRLWLVPASGAKPVALTPQRTPAERDYGDIDAWRLPSGLYLQSAGACGTLEFNKQNANGSITPVKVPGTLNLSTRIVTADGPWLLIDAITGCDAPSQSLLWFNPGTRAERWMFRTPASASGVLAVVPYYSLADALYL
jgi:TolB protein